MSRQRGTTRVKRRERKNVAYGVAHIKSTFNNTLVTITDRQGNVIAWASAGTVGFKGARKGTPYAAGLAAERAARMAMEHGMREIDVYVKGPGSGRAAAIRSWQAAGLEVKPIKDVTPVPHNGCRPPKRRRVQREEVKESSMPRSSGPVCRLCRRAGEKLYLKGDKCYSDKCPVARRTYQPGQHGQRRRKASDYALHLQEKQKLRRIYGVLERQFSRYYEMAAKAKGVTGETLLQILERRLDNVVYRLGFGVSRPQARQLVMHGHVAVNGRKVDIPSYLVKPGDVISIRERSRDLDLIKANVEAAQQ